MAVVLVEAVAGVVVGVDGADEAVAFHGHAVAVADQLVVLGHLFEEVTRIWSNSQLPTPALLASPTPAGKHLQEVDDKRVLVGRRFGDERSGGSGHEGEDGVGLGCVEVEGEEGEEGVGLEFDLPLCEGLEGFVVF